MTTFDDSPRSQVPPQQGSPNASDAQRIPYASTAQRAIARQWERVVDGHLDSQVNGQLIAADARPVVRDSWQRSLLAAIPADLPRAPMLLSADSLHDAREHADWVPLALRAAQQLNGSFTDGHVLSLFDANACMLVCDGDPAVLDRLADINFGPGALWSESAVGTNGPGTALATRRSVHIVGAEHFCESWQQWHCAAVPLCDAATGDVLGIIDISGFRQHAHPHTLELAVALASSVQQMLIARETERRCAVLHRFAELTGEYGQDALVAVDRRGLILHATRSAPAGLRPDTTTPETLRSAIAAHVRTTAPVPRTDEVFLSVGHDIGVTATSFPVLENGIAVGACLLLHNGVGVRSVSVSVPAAVGASTQAGASAGAFATANGADMRASERRFGMRRTTTRLDERRGATYGAVNGTSGNATRYTLLDIIGAHPRIVEAIDIAIAAAGNALPVFIAGESGTGKEVFAQAIHAASDRQHKPFIAVNCAALPTELVEAELFGYVGGAFTGARREGSEGKFRAAEGGTIFLDEISELPPVAQAALLRVLQEQEITAVGSTVSRPIDVRVIAATNRPVERALADGALRRDLFYRLNVLALDLPPLRDRLDDVPALAKHFLEGAALEVGRPGLTVAPAVLDILARNAWPGNVRELRNLIRRLASLCVGNCITIGQLPPAILSGVGAESPRRMLDAEVPAAPSDTDRAATLDAMATSRNMSDAAARLGINRSTLYRRLEKYGVKPERTMRVE